MIAPRIAAFPCRRAVVAKAAFTNMADSCSTFGLTRREAFSRLPPNRLARFAGDQTPYFPPFHITLVIIIVCTPSRVLSNEPMGAIYFFVFEGLEEGLSAIELA